MDNFSSANVENIDKSEIDSFYASVPVKDLELLVGPVITNSRPGSPTAEQDKEVPGAYKYSFLQHYIIRGIV